MKKRLFLSLLAAMGSSLLVLSGPAAAQSSYPDKPVTLIVPFSPGGSGDTVARLVADKVSSILGQPLVIENVAGASGAIGVQKAIRSRADGYTLLQISGGNAMLPLMKKGVYDLDQLKPIISPGAAPYVFAVNAKSGINSFDDLAALAEKESGARYGSAGIGTLAHLCPERLAAELNFKAINVPFQGASAAAQALLANEVDFICTNDVVAQQFVKNGTIRVLGTATPARLNSMPDAPTMAEQGFDNFDVSTWHAFMAPIETPAEVVSTLQKAFTEALDDAGIQQQLQNIGIQVSVRSGEELSKFIVDEQEMWRVIIEKNNITMGN